MCKSFFAVFSFLMIVTPVVTPQRAFGANPPPNTYELVVDTTLGRGPFTVDPAYCYDSASAELIFNTYEALIFFDGECYDVFIPMLATQVWIAPPDPAAPAYTNYTLYFKIRTGVPFHNSCRTDEPFTWDQYYLTTEDVEYSFERWMVHDYLGGPQWMIYEPLLDCYGANITDPDFGIKIDNSIQRNETHIWFNIANPSLASGGAVSFVPVKMFDVEDGHFNSVFWEDVATLPLGYSLRILFQVISESWSSILSRQCIVNFVNPWLSSHGLGNMTDWEGNFVNWTDYTGWDVSPLDRIGTTSPGVMCGTGPYILDRYDPSVEWSAVKHNAYWRGWSAQWPSPPYSPLTSSGIKPAGYVTRLTIRQKLTSGCISDLVSGNCDITAVPFTRAGELHGGTNRSAPTKLGIRLNYPIPSLTVTSMHYTFIIEPTPDNKYGKINPNDTLSEDGIPANFFEDIHVRKAFTYLFNFTFLTGDQMLGEAYQPLTCAPSGLPYVNLTQPKYGPEPDSAKAKTEFDQAFGGNLKNVGFNVTITCNAGSGPIQSFCAHLKFMVEKIGTDVYGGRFHASVKYVPWGSYITDMELHELPLLPMGYLADYADLYSYMYIYMHSQGYFAAIQRYNNSETDNLLDRGSRMPDGPIRQAAYYRLQEIYYNDVPSVALYITLGRGYSRTWVNGLYYNPVYPGVYAYNVWKWEYLPGNVDYDNKVSMGDIITIIDAFGSFASKQGSLTNHQRWNFYTDVDGIPCDTWRDRKIDMGDIITAVSNFGKTEPVWTPP